MLLTEIEGFLNLIILLERFLNAILLSLDYRGKSEIVLDLTEIIS